MSTISGSIDSRPSSANSHVIVPWVVRDREVAAKAEGGMCAVIARRRVGTCRAPVNSFCHQEKWKKIPTCGTGAPRLGCGPLWGWAEGVLLPVTGK